VKKWDNIDVNRAWSKLTEYAIRAEEELSPLIAPWANAFLCQGKEEWKKSTVKMPDDDPAIRWVYMRAQPMPLDAIWEEWSDYLQEVFHDLL
jgi:L-rhamnose mutarotase